MTPASLVPASSVGQARRGNVATHGGCPLHGQLQSVQQSRFANLVASGVVGLRGVHNELSVRAKSPRSDDQIAAEIEARLRWDALVHGELVKVGIDDGRVVLAGTVVPCSQSSRVRAAEL